MRWKARTPDDEWHPWFAWHPVRIEGEIVWLETVMRSNYFLWHEELWKYRNVELPDVGKGVRGPGDQSQPPSPHGGERR